MIGPACADVITAELLTPGANDWEGFFKFPSDVNTEPCVGGAGISWGEKQPNAAYCAASCAASASCKFVAFCEQLTAAANPSTTGCVEDFANLCVRYTKCDSLATAYPQMAVYAKEGAVPGAHSLPTETTKPPRSVWEHFAKFPAVAGHQGVCQGIPSQIIAGRKVADEGACSQICLDDPRCKFVSFCKTGNANCVGAHENFCALFKTCDTFEAIPAAAGPHSYKGYKTWHRIGA